MGNRIRSVLSSGGGGGGTTIKDAYRAKVNEAGLTVYIPTVYEDRCTINEGKIAVDTTNKIVYVYLDFTILTTMSGTDYYGVITLTGLSSSNLPLRHPSTTRQEQSLCTDESSTDPTKSWFVWPTSSILRVSIRQTQGFAADEHYYVYGSWQY